MTKKTLQQKTLLLSWPVSPQIKISRGFSQSSPHHGIDLPGPIDKKVLSAHKGYVVYAGNDYKGYGNLVIIDSGQGWATFYAHLNRILVREKHFISRGHVVGTIGMTGRTSGSHLHFELRQQKIPVDPRRYLP